MRSFQEELCTKINLENTDTFVFPNLFPEEVFCSINDAGEFVPAVPHVDLVEQSNLKITIDNGLFKNNKNEIFDTFQINKSLQRQEEETFLVVMDQQKNIYSCIKINHQLEFKKIFLCLGNTFKNNNRQSVWFEEDDLCYDYKTISDKNNVLNKQAFYEIYQPNNIKKYNTRQLLIEKGFVIKILDDVNGPSGVEVKHSSLLSGKPASFAGEISCQNGKPYLINNISGHYRTKPDFLNFFVDYLRTSGVDLDGCQINLRKSNVN